MYKELTILGVISFTLFILEEEHVVEHGSMLLSFHFVHLAVFFLGGIFICQAVVAAIATYGIRNMWLRTGLIQLDALERSMHAYDRTWLGRRGDALRRLGFNFTRLRQQLEFHVFKSFFIGTYKLPATFRYSRYCVHNLKETFLRTIDHGVLGWACLLLFVALDWLAARAGTFGKKNNRNGGLLIWSSPRGFAVVGYVLLGLESAIVAVLQRAIVRFLHKRGLDADGSPASLLALVRKHWPNDDGLAHNWTPKHSEIRALPLAQRTRARTILQSSEGSNRMTVKELMRRVDERQTAAAQAEKHHFPRPGESTARSISSISSGEDGDGKVEADEADGARLGLADESPPPRLGERQGSSTSRKSGVLQVLDAATDMARGLAEGLAEGELGSDGRERRPSVAVPGQDVTWVGKSALAPVDRIDGLLPLGTGLRLWCARRRARARSPFAREYVPVSPSARASPPPPALAPLSVAFAGTRSPTARA